MHRYLAILVGAHILATAQFVEASPAISAIAPFEGEFSEGFEGFPFGEIPGPEVHLAGPVPILQGRGVLTGVHSIPVNPFYIWDLMGGLSLDDKGEAEGHVTAVPFDGIRGLYLQSGEGDLVIGRIDFPTPVREFGGYWVHSVTQDFNGPITIEFLDAEDSLIATEQFRYDYARLQGVSQWFGWRSAVPIHAVKFTGLYTAVDGIQIRLVPEPGGIFLVGICLALAPYFRNRYRLSGGAADCDEGGTCALHK